MYKVSGMLMMTEAGVTLPVAANHTMKQKNYLMLNFVCTIPTRVAFLLMQLLLWLEMQPMDLLLQ